MEPSVGLDLTTMRSWPEPKSRVGRLTNWATQVPQLRFFWERWMLAWKLALFPTWETWKTEHNEYKYRRQRGRDCWKTGRKVRKMDLFGWMPSNKVFLLIFAPSWVQLYSAVAQPVLIESLHLTLLTECVFQRNCLGRWMLRILAFMSVGVYHMALPLGCVSWVWGQESVSHPHKNPYAGQACHI